MNRAALLLLLLATFPACRPATEKDTAPERTPVAEAPSPSPEESRELTGRMWVRTDPSAPVGEMRAFLPDGTLLMDSCWGTYRLVHWRQSGQTLTWNEDGMDIQAEIVSLTAQELHLRLNLVDGPQDQRYEPATVPFTCPDMPR
jgi:hypothetical protein